ncbi:MAG: ABC transporter ATP-binding protein [Gammaproteobacteria bacterium]|nr:ABC transporter ATP-binding protein [Gammaproteobacteria bacterium]MBT3725327.1 ABC transporter ATP-binding protein [Gammaproteobacteria bacterium]MBT4076818.1 ABC transporter ATP-binding protein [Gammaproteobacteria bacterium]MBT4195373.1 ABC transporter ATP-binding protein [Gammaproteobacteria bacterium]MBT4449676.1 ABC transporter ATP-binding protein [Gammaproteobacteria bacterium]
MNSNISNYALIWRVTRGQRKTYILAILALLAASVFMYLAPLIPQMVLDGIIGPNPDKATSISLWLIEFLGGRDFLSKQNWTPALLIVVLTALAGVFTYLRGRWTALASEATVCKVRDQLLDKLMHLPVSFYDKAQTGDLVQRCTSDVDTLRLFLEEHVVEIGRACVMLIAPIPLLLSMDVGLTLASMVLIPPLVAFSYFYFKSVKRFFKDADEAEGRMTAVVQENLTGIRVVRAFARQDFENKKFHDASEQYRSLDLRMYRLMANYWAVSDLICLAQIAIVVILGGYWLMQGSLSVGVFYFFLSAVSLFIWPMRMLGRILTQLGKATVAIGRLEEILGHPEESDPDMDENQLDGQVSLKFDNVVFSHNEDKAALDGVSFELKAGQTIALLGSSGSGKSTIVNLLLRFYDPNSGKILLDGQDVTTMVRKSVREKIAVVMQEPFLYSRNLLENIRLGRPQATESEIVDVATTACVHHTIESFDLGYKTEIGERGITLSGGQRQRVALARALLEKPSLLILDDALSAVDTDTERLILNALREGKNRQSTIVIAHRLSTLMHADIILVLKEGRVEQQGTHESLSQQAGIYRDLWHIQSDLEANFKTEKVLVGASHE